MKHLILILILVTSYLFGQPTNNCQILTNYCGGSFMDPNTELCLRITCHYPGQVPQVYNECRPIVNGQACGFSNYPNNDYCGMSWKIPGFYGTVSGQWGNLRVRRWLPANVKLENSVLNSTIVNYEQDPLDSYYNYSHSPLIVCSPQTNVLDFMNQAFPGHCLTIQIFRTTGFHPLSPYGSSLQTMVLPFQNQINIDQLIDATNVPLNEVLVIKISGYCCGSGPNNDINMTKYIYIRKLAAPQINYQFMTSSLGDGLIDSGQGDNPTDNLENIGTSIFNSVTLSPYSCGVYIPDYTNNFLFGRFKLQIWRIPNCTSGDQLILETPFKDATQWPAQINFNSEFISNPGYFAINYNNGSLFGHCYKFVIVAENPCSNFVELPSYFKFTPQVYALEKSKGGMEESNSVDNYSLNSTLMNELVEAFPNPTEDEIYFTNMNLIDNIEIISVNGKSLTNFKPQNSGDNLNLENYLSGIYIGKIHLKSGEHQLIKIIKK